MKKIISVLVLALLASGMSLTAQNRGNGAPQGAGEKMGKPGMGMMKQLNLTDDQIAKLKVMHEGFAAQDSVAKVERMKQREALQAERHLALAKILTPEQLAQLDKLQVEKGQRAGKKGQFGPGNGQLGFRQGGFAAGQGGRPMMGQGRGQMMGQGRGQMMGQGRGQMMNKRAQMLQGRGMQNGRMPQMNGRLAFNKKNAKAFMKHAKQMNKAPMVNPEVRIKSQVERMTKLLDLTPEQASKIQAIQEKHFKSDIAKYKKFEKKRDAQMKKRHGNLDEIKAVLTPEQIKKLDALKEKGPKMERPNGPMNGPMNSRANGPMNGPGEGRN
jgi:Spy/CpxP family protein refolding chaperone